MYCTTKPSLDFALPSTVIVEGVSNKAAMPALNKASAVREETASWLVGLSHGVNESNVTLQVYNSCINIRKTNTFD